MELQRFSKTWREKQKTAKQFIQDESFANAVLETLVASESVNLRNLKEQTITKWKKT